MDWDEARPKPGATVTIGEDLSGLGISELEHRITSLHAEIARVETELQKKRAHEAAASALFKS